MKNKYCISCGKEAPLIWPEPKMANAEPVACSKGCVAYTFLHRAESTGDWKDAYCCRCGASANNCSCIS